MFFFLWRKKGSKDQSLPMILQWTNVTNEVNNSKYSLQVQQQNGQTATSRDVPISQVQKRHSSYRSQLSSAGSFGTVITYADGMI